MEGHLHTAACYARRCCGVDDARLVVRNMSGFSGDGGFALYWELPDGILAPALTGTERYRRERWAREAGRRLFGLPVVRAMC